MRLTPDHGAARGRLEDDRVAGHAAPPTIGPAARAIGKLKGLMTAKTPWGRRIERVWTVASPEVVHRVVVAVVVLHRLGVVADEVGRLLDLAERLEPVLADLDGHQSAPYSIWRSLISSAARRRIARRSCQGVAAPGRLGGAGGGDRVARRPGGRPWRRSRRGSRGRSASAASNVAVAVAHVPVDEVAVVGAEARLGLLEARLVERRGAPRCRCGASRR